MEIKIRAAQTFDDLLKEIESVKDKNKFISLVVKHTTAILLDHADLLELASQALDDGKFKEGFLEAIAFLRDNAEPPEDLFDDIPPDEEMN